MGGQEKSFSTAISYKWGYQKGFPV